MKLDEFAPNVIHMTFFFNDDENHMDIIFYNGCNRIESSINKSQIKFE